MTTAPEQIFDMTPYAEQLDILQSDPGARIVGSLGRMVLCKQILDNPFLEIEERLKYGITLAKRQPDIDVLNASDEVVEAARAVVNGRVIDTIAFNDTDLAVYCERYSYAWILECKDQGVKRVIDSKFMSPNVEKIQGVEIVTLPRITQHLLHNLRARDGLKDRIATYRLNLLGKSDMSLTKQDAIDGGLYRLTQADIAPFDAIRRAIGDNDHTYSGRHSAKRHSEADYSERHSA